MRIEIGLMKTNHRGMGPIGIVAVTVALVTAAGLWLFSSQTGINAGTSNQYSINGLSCQFQATTPAYVRDIVASLGQNARFLSATNGSPFMLGGYGNITDRTQIVGGKLLSGPTQNGSVVGGTTIRLPDVVELVFYNVGPNTTCNRQVGSGFSIDVQVPIQNGGLNMTGAHIDREAFPAG